MPDSGNVSERVVLAAMLVKIPQIYGQRHPGTHPFNDWACPTRAHRYVDNVISPHNSNDLTNSRPPNLCACGPGWRLPLLLALVLIAMLVYRWRGIRTEAEVSTAPAAPTQGEAPPVDAPLANTVSLVVDFGDGNLPKTDKAFWTKGMTVRDLLNGVPRQSVSQQGAGAAAFLVSIDSVKNEGAGGRNWMYSVNGKRADRSFAVYELQPGDVVVWSFAPLE